MKRYFLSCLLGGEKVEREVTLEEFCRAERAAGFRPKLWSGDPAYMTTPATGGFSNSNGISGRTEYVPNAQVTGRGGIIAASCGLTCYAFDWRNWNDRLQEHV